MEDEIETEPQTKRIGVLGGDGLWSVAEVLRASGVNVADLEPAPKQAAAEVARKWHFGLASVRAGLLGHPRAILQLVQQLDNGLPQGWIQVSDGLAWDGFRPEVDPEGMAPEGIETYRLAHLAALARLLQEVDRLILPLCVTRARVNGAGLVLGGRGQGLAEVDFTLEELRADLQALLAHLARACPALEVQVAILPSLADQPDGLACEMTLRRALEGTGAQRDPVFDALLLQCQARATPSPALALLARGLDLAALPEAPVPQSAGTPSAVPEAAASQDDREARRKARRAKRKAKGGEADRNKVICEDELLEAFAK